MSRQNIYKLSSKIKKIIGLLWEKTPLYFRQKFIRSTQNKFTFSVAGIIFNEKGEFLLLKHILRSYYNWGMAGGFANHGEQPEEALRRELREETGIELRNVEIFRVRTLGRHVEIILRAEGIGDPKVNSLEISALGWFPADDLPERLAPVQKTMLKDFSDTYF